MIYLAVAVSLLAGFQIGSIVEYVKKYNFFDLEKDLVQKLITHIEGFVNGAETKVKAAEAAL